MNYLKSTIVVMLAFCVTATTVNADAPLAAHPKDLKFPELNYQVPPAAEFREVLSNGIVVYIAEDRELPTFDLAITVRTGGAFDPPGKEGLAGLAGEMIRDGGTQNVAPAELDEQLDFLAASIRTGVSDTAGRASLSCLAKDVDESLTILMDVLRYPRFDEERIRLATERRLQDIKRRNDSTGSIEGIEWDFLMYGNEHFMNSYPSSASLQAITRDDLIAFHHEYFHPGNMMISVAGDFDRNEMLAKLEKTFADWPAGKPTAKKFDGPTFEPKPGVYLIDKADVNQGRVSLGHRSIMRGTPDEYALRVMNNILGGSGFQSRLVARVRSDEGLAYSVGSGFGQGTYYPGDFRCFFQSKSNSCAYAAQLVIEQIKRLHDEKVAQDELDQAISYITENFPSRFPNKMAILRTYARDEYTGRDPGYWQSVVDKVKKVTADDVQRVARKYLHSDNLVILAVGDAKAIRGGGHDKAADLKLDAFGTVTELPLRDPDTLER